jgi:hypothetical protein
VEFDRYAVVVVAVSASWIVIPGRHVQEQYRGRVHIQAHPLRPIQHDVRAGHRAGETERDKLRKLLDCAADMTGQARRPTDQPLPRWFGVGPTLLTRHRPPGEN